MHCETQLDEGLFYIGGSDRRIHLFENVYPLTNGVSYNSYLYLDEKTVLLDTVDKAVSGVFYDNLEFLLQGRKLDYLIVNHMEPDHAANIGELLLRYPDVTVVVNAMSERFLHNFFPHLKCKIQLVKEGDKLCSGKRTFTFVMAPMVHWPEVMFTYELTGHVLFSADAFGTFGALSGNIYADELNFDKLYLEDCRRYYTNIVGKYGDQVMAVLNKAAGLDIKMICPLHGPVYHNNLNFILQRYLKWATYTPEDSDGVMIAYGSVYGDTANACDVLAKDLAERGVRNLVMYDVSKTDSSYLIAEAFRVKVILLCATTYNAGVFVKMEDFLHDLANHKIRNRTIGFMENGSWAPNAKVNMQSILKDLENITYLEKSVTMTSTLKDNQLEDVALLAEAVVASLRPASETVADSGGLIDASALFNVSYGLFILHTREENGKDNACVVNSFIQCADKPQRVLLSVNKLNYSHDLVAKTGIFNISILTESTPFSTIKRFGFASGRNGDKMAGFESELSRSQNGLYYIHSTANSFVSCRVLQAIDCGSHTLFVCEVTEAKNLSKAPSLTYAYYFANIKPKPIVQEKKIGWRCKICGYFYEGKVLPKDFVCPICKHGAEDFEKVGF